jgi:diketogulonate reductase-like aldo/keto reductase
VAVVAYSPIAKGKVKTDETLNHLASLYGKTPAQICLRWLVQQNVIAIPRTTRVERLSENIDVFDFELSEADMATIFALANPKGRIVDYGFAPKWD